MAEANGGFLTERRQPLSGPLKIAIFGVGLIGGSLALCFKGKPGVRVVGHSPRPSSVRKYEASGVVDEATTSLAEAAEERGRELGRFVTDNNHVRAVNHLFNGVAQKR